MHDKINGRTAVDVQNVAINQLNMLQSEHIAFFFAWALFGYIHGVSPGRIVIVPK